MDFEWDAEKNQRNISTHGVAFQLAARVFDGPILARLDDRFDYGEERYLCIGRANEAVLTVAYTHRGDRIRLISARRATRKERETYYAKIR